jgi:hypothetical protein
VGDEGLSVASRHASWHHNCTGTGYSSAVLFWLFRGINGDKVATDHTCFLIFRELAWREERSKELILFKIDESEESKSWNETKIYE